MQNKHSFHFNFFKIWIFFSKQSQHFFKIFEKQSQIFEKSKKFKLNNNKNKKKTRLSLSLLKQNPTDTDDCARINESWYETCTYTIVYENTVFFFFCYFFFIFMFYSFFFSTWTFKAVCKFRWKEFSLVLELWWDVEWGIYKNTDRQAKKKLQNDFLKRK